MEQFCMTRPPQSFTRTPLTARIGVTTYQDGLREELRRVLMPLTEHVYSDEEMDNVILKREGVRHEGVFLATLDGVYVGTTTGVCNADGTGTLHMVSVLTEASGHKLGRILCECAMAYLIDSGCTLLNLNTDDHRLPAIVTYLNLGFAPVVNNDEQRERWRKVYANIGRPFAE